MKHRRNISLILLALGALVASHLAVGATPTEMKTHLDAPKLALSPKGKAHGLLKASGQWRSISWEPANSHGHDEPMFALVGVDGTIGQVIFEGNRVAALTLVLLPYRTPSPELLSALNLPKPTGAIQTFPLGMRWRDSKGKYKLISMLGMKQCPGYAPTGGCTNLFVDFLRVE